MVPRYLQGLCAGRNGGRFSQMRTLDHYEYEGRRCKANCGGDKVLARHLASSRCHCASTDWIVALSCCRVCVRVSSRVLNGWFQAPVSYVRGRGLCEGRRHALRSCWVINAINQNGREITICLIEAGSISIVYTLWWLWTCTHKTCT